MSAEHKLSKKTRDALTLVREHGISYKGDPDRYASVVTASTVFCDGQPWVNWRTAYAIERAGLGKVTGFGEETELVVFGRAAGEDT